MICSSQLRSLTRALEAVRRTTRQVEWGGRAQVEQQGAKGERACAARCGRVRLLLSSQPASRTRPLRSTPSQHKKRSTIACPVLRYSEPPFNAALSLCEALRMRCDRCEEPRQGASRAARRVRIRVVAVSNACVSKSCISSCIESRVHAAADATSLAAAPSLAHPSLRQLQLLVCSSWRGSAHRSALACR